MRLDVLGSNMTYLMGSTNRALDMINGQIDLSVLFIIGLTFP